MVADVGVNFDLHAFDVRSVSGIDADDPSANEDAAVSALFTLEAHTQIEVAIGLLCSQVAVFVVRALAEDRAVLNYPFFFAVILPAGQVFAIEQRGPAAFGGRLGRAQRRKEREERKHEAEGKQKDVFHELSPFS